MNGGFSLPDARQRQKCRLALVSIARRYPVSLRASRTGRTAGTEWLIPVCQGHRLSLSRLRLQPRRVRSATSTARTPSRPRLGSTDAEGLDRAAGEPRVDREARLHALGKADHRRPTARWR
jgi:hypothetical protein